MITQHKPAKAIFFIFLFTFAFVFSVLPTYAKKPYEYNIKEEKTIPGNLLYAPKRLSEKLIYSIKLNKSSKLKYSQILTDKRLSELISVVDKKDLSFISTSSQRFSYQAGITAELSNTKNEYKSEIPILEELRDNFPANSAYWLFLQQNIDTLNILSSE